PLTSRHRAPFAVVQRPGPRSWFLPPREWTGWLDWPTRSAVRSCFVDHSGPPGGRSRQTGPSTHRIGAAASHNHLVCHTIPSGLARQTVLASSLPDCAIDQWKEPSRSPVRIKLRSIVLLVPPDRQPRLVENGARMVTRMALSDRRWGSLPCQGCGTGYDRGCTSEPGTCAVGRVARLRTGAIILRAGQFD